VFEGWIDEICFSFVFEESLQQFSLFVEESEEGLGARIDSFEGFDLSAWLLFDDFISYALDVEAFGTHESFFWFDVNRNLFSRGEGEFDGVNGFSEFGSLSGCSQVDRRDSLKIGHSEGLLSKTVNGGRKQP